MNREQLIALGLTEEQADKVIAGYGHMVPKTRLDDKIQDLKDLQQTLADRDKQLEELKKVDVSKLQEEITKLQTANETLKTEYETKLAQREFDYALENALRDAKAKNPKAVKALLNSEGIKLVDGKLTGLDDQLKALKASDDYLFQSDGVKGKTPPGGNGAGNGTTITKEQFAQMSIADKTKLYNENKELYNSLRE